MKFRIHYNVSDAYVIDAKSPALARREFKEMCDAVNIRQPIIRKIKVVS